MEITRRFELSSIAKQLLQGMTREAVTPYDSAYVVNGFKGKDLIDLDSAFFATCDFMRWIK